MNSLFDLLLRRPLPMDVIRGLLFGTFGLHMLFVLFTIGTAVLALFYFLRSGWSGKTEERGWAKSIMQTFLAHKSLAVVLGVAPLLLIQIGFTVPFFTAVSLFAPFWLMIIVFLIGSFLLFEYVGHNMAQQCGLRTAAGLVAMALLLAVPGILVAVLVTMENSGQWLAIVQNGFKMTGTLAVHWLPRFLHVIGAGIVFGAVFHYLSARSEETARRAALIRWVIAGLLVQFVLGFVLYLSLPSQPDAIVKASVTAGVLAALALGWYALSRQGLALKPASLLLLLILVPMLLTRQLLQDHAVLPLNEQLDQTAALHATTLEPYTNQALTNYEANLYTAYETGGTIYNKSCSFCHGEQANGKGQEAASLAVPPEAIASVRTQPAYLRERLLQGVDGSAMPYFTVYTRDQLDRLVTYLDEQFGVLGAAEPVTTTLSSATLQQAQQQFDQTCAACHGTDGTGRPAAALGLKPPPPDFRHYTLLPQRAFDVISNGYPGTAMASFATLDADLRWGLASHVLDFYQKNGN